MCFSIYCADDSQNLVMCIMCYLWAQSVIDPLPSVSSTVQKTVCAYVREGMPKNKNTNNSAIPLKCFCVGFWVYVNLACLFVSAFVTKWYASFLGDGKCWTLSCVTSQTKSHKTSFVAGANTWECSSVQTKLFQWKMRANKNQEENVS